jgi:hypothetical protein
LRRAYLERFFLIVMLQLEKKRVAGIFHGRTVSFQGFRRIGKNLKAIRMNDFEIYSALIQAVNAGNNPFYFQESIGCINNLLL